MWYAGSLYVAAPPSIWKLTDTDGDGVADRRVEWFAGKTLTGCANDLHGPYLGRDGWIYWCKGAFARQTYERPGKPPFVTRAAHIFRCRPDGTGIEPVMTGGMDNPVDVVFTPGGERIFTTTFLVHPGGGDRDGLIHAIYGGIYGKVHDPIFEPAHKWTGPEVMPVLLHMGSAAPCGLTRYESDAFGNPDQDNLFACYFNLHKVGRHSLVPVGATFTTKDEDFVSSPNLDFHPTDVLEDADGSLVIVDTGGWYKLCCPTSQLQKPDVLGGIYRVRKAGASRIDDPRGTVLLSSERHQRDERRRHLGNARQVPRRPSAGRAGAQIRIPVRPRPQGPRCPRCAISPPRTPRRSCGATPCGPSPGSTIPPRGCSYRSSSGMPMTPSGRPRFMSRACGAIMRPRGCSRCSGAIAPTIAAPRPKPWAGSATRPPCLPCSRPPEGR